jgi:hypothetical protein
MKTGFTVPCMFCDRRATDWVYIELLDAEGKTVVDGYSVCGAHQRRLQPEERPLPRRVQPRPS